MSITLPAPAKLNLFLHITGRRNDGYHELQTLFQLLDVGDTIRLEAAEELELASTMTGVASEDNLVMRAARLLQAHTGCTLGARIHIDKHLPMGGGLGGGSSDAASTLSGLNTLWQLGLDTETLCKLGLQLGADVPVFVLGKTAFAEGIGEILYPIQTSPAWYTIACPDCHVTTSEIFSNQQLTRDTPPIKIPAFFDSTKANAYRNDCQAIVAQRYPEVAQALTLLEQTSATARMTGTGACIFAAFASKHEAEQAKSCLPASLASFIAQGVQESPALLALHRQQGFDN